MPGSNIFLNTGYSERCYWFFSTTNQIPEENVDKAVTNFCRGLLVQFCEVFDMNP
jgi:hypothetical protein